MIHHHNERVQDLKYDLSFFHSDNESPSVVQKIHTIEFINEFTNRL